MDNQKTIYTTCDIGSAALGVAMALKEVSKTICLALVEIVDNMSTGNRTGTETDYILGVRPDIIIFDDVDRFFEINIEDIAPVLEEWDRSKVEYTIKIKYPPVMKMLPNKSNKKHLSVYHRKMNDSRSGLKGVTIRKRLGKK